MVVPDLLLDHGSNARAVALNQALKSYPLPRRRPEGEAFVRSGRGMVSNQGIRSGNAGDTSLPYSEFPKTAKVRRAHPGYEPFADET